MPDGAGTSCLAVVPGQVGDAAGGWSADGGVVAVMVVGVEPGVKGSGSGCFFSPEPGVAPFVEQGVVESLDALPLVAGW
jgi:hypothetical protein